MNLINKIINSGEISLLSKILRETKSFINRKINLINLKIQMLLSNKLNSVLL